MSRQNLKLLTHVFGGNLHFRDHISPLGLVIPTSNQYHTNKGRLNTNLLTEYMNACNVFLKTESARGDIIQFSVQ